MSKQRGGIFDIANWQLVDCPLCAGREHIVLSNVDRLRMGITTVACDDCGMVFTNPAPNASMIEEFYDSQYRQLYREKATISPRDIKALGTGVRARETASFLYNEGFLDRVDSVLDIGAADGQILGAIKDIRQMKTMFAVEPNEIYREYMVRNINAAIVSTLTEVDVKTKFDLIIINHVLEHIVRPSQYLEDLVPYLSDDGFLYVDVPDVDCYSSIDDLHVAHVLHFSTVTLENLFRTMGFFIVYCDQHNPRDHPRSIRCVAQRSREIRDSIVLNVNGDTLARRQRRFYSINRSASFYYLLKSISRIISVGRIRRAFRRL